MYKKYAAMVLITLAGVANAQNGSGQNYQSARCENGILEISGDNGAYRLLQYCETVMIAGSDNKVILGDVGRLEIAGADHDVAAGNVRELELAGGDIDLKTANIQTAVVEGNDHNVLALDIRDVDVAGGGHMVAGDRMRRIEIVGNDNIVEYRRLNPNPRNPRKPTHPARSVGGSSNSVRWKR